MYLGNSHFFPSYSKDVYSSEMYSPNFKHLMYIDYLKYTKHSKKRMNLIYNTRREKMTGCDPYTSVLSKKGNNISPVTPNYQHSGHVLNQ